MFLKRSKSADAIETKRLALPLGLLALEPRYVFDAALTAQLAEASGVDVTAYEVAPDHAAEVSGLIDAARESVDIDALASTEVRALIDATVEAHNLSAQGREIVFIDDRLADLGTLVAAVPDGTRVVLINAEQDGVAQMVDALRGAEGVTGIHIISHGQAGALELGGSTLTADSMSTVYRSALESLATHLSADADIIVYGCNFGAGEAGAAATDMLAELTGADVAASDGLTGAEALGGDWVMEVRHGSIETGVVEAMTWRGVLDPLNISATTAPVVRDNTGTIVTAANMTIGGVAAVRHITDVTKMVGATVVWANAGTVGGVAIDLRATVLSVVDTNPNSGQSPGLHFTISNGDDPSVRVDNAEVRIRWDAFQAGTYDPVTGTGVIAEGDVGFFIRDIDALGHIYSAPGVMSYYNMSGIKPQESVRADLDELASFQTEALANTHLTVGLNLDPDTGATVTNPLDPSYGRITATNLVDTEFAGSESGIKFNWIGVSSWEVTYRVAPPPGLILLDAVPTNGTADTSIAGTNHGQRFFDHDGDGDLAFVNVRTVDMRHLDLDGNDSTSAGDNYESTFTENGAAVAIVDTDVDISGFDTHIESATVVLTNAQAGDVLLVGGVQSASGTVNGLAYTVTNSAGAITVQLTGSTMDPTVYETALKQIAFDNSSHNLDTDDRTINVWFNNGTVDSNIAISTIHIAANDPPVLVDPDPTAGTPAIDAGDPSNLLVPATDGVALTLPLASYLADPESDPLVVTPDPAAIPSWLTWDAATSTFSGTPPADNTGEVAIPVTLDDGINPPVTITVTIQPVNPGPTANPDTTTTGEGVAVVVDLLGNDTDPDNDPLTVTAASVDPAEGTVAFDGTDWVFTPAPGFNGTATISYTVQDQDGATSSSTHTVTVTPNDPPVLVDPDPTAGTPAIDAGDPSNLLVPATDGVALTLPLASYLADPESDPLVVTPDPAAIPSWLTWDAATSTFSGTPPADNTGEVAIPVTLDDGINPPVTITVTIQPVNPGPTANPDTTTTGEGVAVVVDLLGNDTDPDNDPLTVTAASVAPAEGTVAFGGTDWVFTPAPGFNGTATISYTVQDQDGATSSSTHTVTVTPNDPPVLVDPDPTAGTPAIDAGDPSNLLVPATDGVALTLPLASYLADPESDPLVVTPDPAAIPSWLTWDAATSTFSGTPPADNTGEVAIPVTLDDGINPPVTITVTIQPVNPGPTANPDTTTTGEGVAVVVDLLGNDTDPDNDPLTVTAASVAPAEGTVAFDGTDWVFTPAPGFNGTATISYTVQDQDGATSSSTHTVTVTPNDPPGLIDPDPTAGTPAIDAGDPSNLLVPATDGVALTLPLASYLADPESDPLVVTPDPAAIPSWLTWDAATSTFSGTPPADNTGEVAIPVTLDDGINPPVTITVTIQPVNPGPTAVAEIATTSEDTTLFGDVLANDSDPDGDSLTVTGAMVDVDGDGADDVLALGVPTLLNDSSNQPIGTLTLNADGTYTFEPAPNYNGPVPVVSYTIADGDGAVSDATLEITVTPVNDAPVANPDTTATAYNTPVVVELLANDTDVENDPLTVISATVPSDQGTMSFAGGVWTFIPSVTFSGTATITYTIADTSGETSTSTHSVVVAAPPLSGTTDTFQGRHERLLRSSVAGNDTYAPGSVFQLVKPPASGRLVMNRDGTFTFKPKAGFSGRVSFVYTVTDPTGATVTVRSTIKVSSKAHECMVSFGRKATL